jgi:hypothetical protein
MKKIILLVMFSYFFLGFQTPLSHAATDPRFFGTYCGETSIRECVRYRVCFFLGWPCVTRTRCETLDIRNIKINVTHKEPKENVGLIEGNGTAKVDGKNLVFNFGATVSGYGIARGSVAGNYFDPNMGIVRLSPDGLALTINSRGKTLTIRKDACGNNPPGVSITSPADGATLTYGDSQPFSGEVTTDEDVSFPPKRMSLTSNRDGILEGYTVYGAKSMSVFTNSLAPGSHVITFFATDSGGLTTSKSINITVSNDTPHEPTIVQPLPTDTIIATGGIIFEGKAYDPEDGMLKGDSLVWSTKTGGGPFTVIGKGRSLKSSLNPPGTYTIRLTAVDSLGSENFTERTITVQPYTGNTTPRVTIKKPEHIEWLGMAVLTGTEIEFVGMAEDTEDPVTDLTLEWKAQATNPGGAPTVFGTNTTNAKVTLHSIGTQTTEYTITFSAKDTGGLVGEKIIKIYIMAHPII